ncbi:MAG: hypothetical protein AAGB46_13120 [Verrucomicrobiota bacterium]
MNKRRGSKKAANQLLNRLILQSLGLLAVLGVFGLGTVWFRHQISGVANSINKLDSEIVVEERRLTQLDVELTKAKSASRLQKLNIDLALGLRPPHAGQIYRVSENVEARLDGKTAGAMLTASRTID